MRVAERDNSPRMNVSGEHERTVKRTEQKGKTSRRKCPFFYPRRKEVVLPSLYATSNHGSLVEIVSVTRYLIPRRDFSHDLR